MANLFGGSGRQPIKINVGFNKIITPGASSIQKAVVNIPKSQNQPQLIQKTFGNRDDTQHAMETRMREIAPKNTPPELISALANAGRLAHEDIIDSYEKNPTGFAHISNPLPEGTVWENIKILIDHFDVKNPKRSTVHIIINGKTLKITDFHEMCLEDTVEKKISNTGKMLYLFALGAKFFWHEEVIPDKYKKMKARLSEDLQKCFGIKTDPFFPLNGKEYLMKISLSAREKGIIQDHYPHILTDSGFDLINTISFVSR